MRNKHKVKGLDGVKKISSSRFTWDNYCGTVGLSSNLFWNYDKNSRHFKRRNFEIIGYCDAEELQVRKRDGYAVLVYTEGEEVWFHVFSDYDMGLELE